MKKISFSFLYPLFALILITMVMSRQVFMMPPLGLLLNPFRGIVQNEKSSDVAIELDFGRKEQVEVLFDERAVPHIFAGNQDDLFFAQGYITASNRLWQMDFLSFVSAGRLSEIFGEDLLNYDRNQRRSGIPVSAKKSLAFIEANPETKRALDNYTQGVNKYIDELSQANLPLEYKLMDYRPEQWTNLKSVLIMKYMGALLSGYEEDLASSYLFAVLGKKEYDKLFSNYFINKSKDHFSIAIIKDSLRTDSYIDFSFLDASTQIPESAFNPRLGSNSWAISSKKSVSKAPILCNDPHLNLSFPAIWYELQLSSDKMNVYGYSIAGTPGVIIGYNQNISWGLTNGATDVRDLFKLELKENYSQYRFDGSWKNTEINIEEIKVKNGKLFYDTVFYTVHGPISSDFRFGAKEKRGFATNWTLYQPSNEFLTFIKLNIASNYKEYKEALNHYGCPVQNFIYADIEGNIATNLQGRILKRLGGVTGKFILDGTRSEHLSIETLNNELPYELNPGVGFLCAANNNTFPKEDSLHVNGHYSELRSDKIKQILSRPMKFSVEDMKLMQLDNTNRLAELAVPVLIKFLREENENQIKKFREWDYRCDIDNEMALAFEHWWSIIKTNTWDELQRFDKTNKVPDDLVLLDMIINDPNSKYFDKLSTEEKETAGDIICKSFEDYTQSWLVFPMKWENSHTINIKHLGNIQEFSKMKMPSSGHPNAINAISTNWGPSLRFIVEMKTRPEGYGVYIGGQSGNPASKEYDQFADYWKNGKYYKLNFFYSKEEAKTKTLYKWIIK